MRFGVLGPLAVWTAEGTEVRVPEAKVRALLADLMLHQGRPVPVERLAADLWGERLPGNPANTLQTKVSQLRRVLERAEPGGRALVVHRSAGYALEVPDEAVDAWRFRELTGRAAGTAEPGAKAALLAEAAALWRGPALADFAGEPFAAPLAHRLDEERLAALEELAEVRLALGEVDRVLADLADLVTRYPLRERLRALHMRALYRAGRQSEALAAYRELRQRLADELGLEPGSEVTELHQAILRQEPGLAPPSPRRVRATLPVPLTELVGREEAVREIRSLLGSTRLVTLTGPGGVGKTRLALETARRLADHVPDGVWLAELAGLDRRAPDREVAARVAEAVAAVLGVRDSTAAGARAPLPDRLADAVRDRDGLLVLDNCEQLVEPVAALVARLLRAAPELRVLVTSRQPLGLSGEVLWTVPPLGIPGAGHAGPARPAAEVLRSVREFSAVRLFAARAAAAAPGFRLGEENVHAVAAICRRLDGLPLALELAATRLRALGAHELLARLDDRFAVLAAGYRDAPPRQRTLRAVIDWSWELLDEPERVVLRRLAVHAESCALDAAEAVCAGGPVGSGEVVELLARLVDRSLVVGDDDGRGGRRYRLLESVAAYCLERLAEAGEAGAVRARHAAWYAALARDLEPRLRGPAQRDWLERLDAEAANMRSALDTTVRQGLAEEALRLACALTWYWFLRGRLGEARRSLRASLAVPGAEGTSARGAALAWLAGLDVLAGGRADLAAVATAREIPDAGPRARALWFLGYVLGTVGDLARAEELTALALESFRALDDGWGVAAALADGASQAMARGDLAGARDRAEESARRFRELGDRWGQLQASFALGVLAQIGGDYRAARREHEEGLRLARELGLWPEVSYQLSWLGRVALLTGDADRARELHERALRLAAGQGFAPGEMYARTGLALGARRAGDLDTAERELTVLLEWHRLQEGASGVALILAELGFVAELRGDPERACRLHREGLRVARAGGDPRAVALGLEGMAGVAALAGEHRAAARLLGTAGRIRERVGAPLPPAERGDVDRIAATARAALGERVFAEEYRTGGDEDWEEDADRDADPVAGSCPAS
ncbi:putative ATPase [Prauserella shujinwangii]|uniref:Putative ATPase n=1 Tax=Prauserella shujinwangii TaxID=1453103 RepID=A0A2T0LP49_9PSEU|nr:BTAD domain-containing putative transcriptional regulator [Prauserella shujinwangii]PRX45019.1 putative ATPase [Prauserella shujinwangii]